MAIITLSGRTFSGAKRLAQYISSELGYRMVSREDIIDQLEQYGMSDKRLDRARHRNVGRLFRVDREWKHYFVYARAALSREIQDGNLVYLGDSGRILLYDFPNVLGVRIIADMEYRIGTFMRRNDHALGLKEAKRLIKKSDEKRARWQRALQNGRHLDPPLFHNSIDLALTSFSEACEMIRAAVNRPPFQTTRRSLKAVEAMTLSANLRARIAMNSIIRDDNIEVHVADGVIRMSGSVPSTEDADAIREFLQRQPEVDLSEAEPLNGVPSGSLSGR